MQYVQLRGEHVLDEGIDEIVGELQGNRVELYNFVAENCGTDLTYNEINALVSDFESDYLSLKLFVIIVTTE